MEWGNYYEKNGRFPCPVLMGYKILSESLRDKSIIADRFFHINSILYLGHELPWGCIEGVEMDIYFTSEWGRVNRYIEEGNQSFLNAGQTMA